MHSNEQALPRRWPCWHPHAWPEKAKIVGLLAIAMAVWGWCDVRVRGTIDPNDHGIHKTDFTVYTEAGAAFFDGRKPYEVTNPRGWGYLYPPAFAMLMAPLHPLDPRTQVLVWFAISTCMLYGCYSESLRLARIVLPDRPQHVVFGPVPPVIGWAGMAAALLPALNCLQRGQVGIAKLYLLLLGLRLCLESRGILQSLVAGAVLSLPITLKITPVVPVGLLAAERLLAAWMPGRNRPELRRALALNGGIAGGLALGLLVIPAMLVGWRANLDHLDAWWTRVAVRVEADPDGDFAGDSSSIRNQSLTNAVERAGNWVCFMVAGGPDDGQPTRLRKAGQSLPMDAAWVGTSLRLVRLAAGCLLLWTMYRVARRNDPLELAAAFGVACVATLVLSPIARGHYFVLLLPAAVFMAAYLHRAGRARWASAAAIVPAALSIAHYTLLDVTGQVGLLGLGTAAWYATACVVLGRGVAPRAAAVESPVDAPHAKAA